MLTQRMFWCEDTYKKCHKRWPKGKVIMVEMGYFFRNPINYEIICKDENSIYA